MAVPDLDFSLDLKFEASRKAADDTLILWYIQMLNFTDRPLDSGKKS